MISEKNEIQLVPGLCEGRDIWVLLNQPHFWWDEIDFRTGYQLSSLQKKFKTGFTKSKSSQVEKIAHDIQFPVPHIQIESPFLFVQASNNLKTRWLCLVQSVSDLNHPSFEKNLNSLNCRKIRFFSPLEIPTGLKTSFPDTEFISEP